ncbi:MAG: tRNA U-34 5-methylaminomethyl-2-thiouridine biosynthesis protein [Myxococcota bacterium]
MSTGKVVMGVIAPHPPHLVYAANPPQNEPRSEGGWEELRMGYERLRRQIDAKDYDVIVVHSPHWRTVCGHHFLGVESFKSLSVDPIFPHLFRYTYDLKVDVELAEACEAAAREAGLPTKMMRNPDFRIDYGTVTSCHLVNPAWDKPIVGISANAAYDYFSLEVGDRQMMALGEAVRTAVEKSGKRALVLASSSLSHRHFTEEPAIPEDMSAERPYNHHQYLWDMHVLDLIRRGEVRAWLDEMPDFIEHSVSEARGGSITFMLAAAGYPDYPGEVHAYGTVIGTGNAVVSWDPETTR